MPRRTFAGEAFSRLLQNCVSLAGLTFDRVLGAVRNGIHVTSGPADGIAGGSKHRSADQGSGEDFLDHFQSPGLGG
jgi:hypothetical protein